MRTIIFSHQKGWGEHNRYEEEFEYEDDVTEEMIQEDYEQWVWEQIGDDFSWRDKDEE